MRYTIGRDPAKDRQGLGTIGVHLSKDGRYPSVPHISPPYDDSGIAAVQPVEGLQIQTRDPECFELLANVFIKAAEMLREAMATEIANTIRDE